MATLVGALMIAVVAVGCGASGSTSPTKAEFAQRADAVCGRAEEKRNAAVEAFAKKHSLGEGTPSKAVAEKLVTEAALPPFQDMTAQLAELEPPSGEEDQVKAIVEGFERAIEEVEEDPSSALAGSVDPFSKVSRAASSYGLKTCAAF
jgi:hypothetical protein